PLCRGTAPRASERVCQPAPERTPPSSRSGSSPARIPASPSSSPSPPFVVVLFGSHLYYTTGRRRLSRSRFDVCQRSSRRSVGRIWDLTVRRLLCYTVLERRNRQWLKNVARIGFASCAWSAG